MKRSAIEAILWTLAACLVLPASAANSATAANGQPPVEAGDRRPMNLSEPMPTGMMKPGMTEGDVRKAADRRARQLRPIMKREEASMPATKAKPGSPH